MKSTSRKLLVTLAIVILLVNIASAIAPNHEKTLARAKRYAAQGNVDVALSMLEPLLEIYPGDHRLLKSIFAVY